MIIRVRFSDSISQHTLEEFYSNPKGTCLASLSSYNITPKRLIKEKGLALSFWYISDETMKKHYGVKVCLNSLTSYPGVISVNIVQSGELIYDKLTDMTDQEIYENFLPFLDC